MDENLGKVDNVSRKNDLYGHKKPLFQKTLKEGYLILLLETPYTAKLSPQPQVLEALGLIN